MRFVGSDAQVKRTPEWFRLPKEVQADHDNLDRYCGSVENWGVIRDCRAWSNADWQRVAGTTRQGIRRLVAMGWCRWVQAVDDPRPFTPPAIVPDPAAPHLEVIHYDWQGQRTRLRSSELQRMRANIRWLRDQQHLDEALAKAGGKSGGFLGAHTNGHGHLADAAGPAAADATGGPTGPAAADAPRTAPHRPKRSPPTPPGGGAVNGPSAFDRICDAWPWPETFRPARVQAAIDELGADPPIDQIVAAILRDTRRPAWVKRNERLTCAGYIRARMYLVPEAKKVEPAKPTKQGAPPLREDPKARETMADEWKRRFGDEPMPKSTMKAAERLWGRPWEAAAP